MSNLTATRTNEIDVGMKSIAESGIQINEKLKIDLWEAFFD